MGCQPNRLRKVLTMYHISSFEKKWLKSDIRNFRKDITIIETAITYDLMQRATSVLNNNNSIQKITHTKRNALRKFCKMMCPNDKRIKANKITVKAIRKYFNMINKSSYIPESVIKTHIRTIKGYIHFLVISDILNKEIYDQIKFDH